MHIETPAPLISFNNDQALKNIYVNRLKKHRANGTLIQGVTWSSSKECGCVIGCLFERYDKRCFRQLLDLPFRLAAELEYIFEILPKEEASNFAVNFIEAIPVGIDTSSVVPLMIKDEHEKAVLIYETCASETGKHFSSLFKKYHAYTDQSDEFGLKDFDAQLDKARRQWMASEPSEYTIVHNRVRAEVSGNPAYLAKLSLSVLAQLK